MHVLSCLGFFITFYFCHPPCVLIFFSQSSSWFDIKLAITIPACQGNKATAKMFLTLNYCCKSHKQAVTICHEGTDKGGLDLVGFFLFNRSSSCHNILHICIKCTAGVWLLFPWTIVFLLCTIVISMGTTKLYNEYMPSVWFVWVFFFCIDLMVWETWRKSWLNKQQRLGIAA